MMNRAWISLMTGLAAVTIATPSVADAAFEAFLECRYRDAVALSRPDTPQDRLLIAASWLEEGRIALHAARALADVQTAALGRLMEIEGHTLDLRHADEYIESSRRFRSSPVAVQLDGSEPLNGAIDWKEPTAWDGPPADRTIPLHDPWRMARYATSCFGEARRHLPSAAEVPERFRSFCHLVTGRLALLGGRFDAARSAFSAMNDREGIGTALSATATAIETGAAPALVWGDTSARAAEEAVVTMTLMGAGAWDDFAPALAEAYVAFEDAVSGGRREAGRADVRRFRWAAGTACALSDACAPPKSTVHLYDGRSTPGPETNPPTRVADIVRTNLANLNEQTTMLALVDGVAETLPVFIGVYDALQLYYRYSFQYQVEAPIGE